MMLPVKNQFTRGSAWGGKTSQNKNIVSISFLLYFFLSSSMEEKEEEKKTYQRSKENFKVLESALSIYFNLLRVQGILNSNRVLNANLTSILSGMILSNHLKSDKFTLCSFFVNCFACQ